MAKAKDTNKDPKHHSAVRLDTATMARLDGLRPLYEIPGRKATLSDVLRAVIERGAEVEERRMAEGGGK